MNDKEGEFYQAYTYLKDVKKKYENITDINHYADYQLQRDSEQTELNLGLIFKELGFCARYRFATIKDISIIKKRHQSAIFEHKMVKLDYVLLGFDDKNFSFENYTDSNSVVIYKIENKTVKAFNLYPFVIDLNAMIREKNSRIFFFLNSEKMNETKFYTYYFVKNINKEQDNWKLPLFPDVLKRKNDYKVDEKKLIDSEYEAIQSIETFVLYFK